MAARPVTLPGLLLWLVCVGSAAGVSVLMHPSTPVPVTSTASLPVSEERLIDEFDERLARLERELTELRLALPTAPALQSANEDAERRPLLVPAEDGSLAGLEGRLQRLEGYERARQEMLAEKAAAQALKEEQHRQQQVARRAAAHAIILDPERADSEKARAWRDLRSVGANPWTDEIVLEAVRVGETSSDDRAREVVWIGADTAARNDLLVGPLLRALSGDRVGAVREEAADALGRYLDMPGVREALRRASRADGSDKVRREALEALAAGG